MSLILLSILLFMVEDVFQVISPEKHSKILKKKLYTKLKIFILIADVLLMSVLGVKFLLSRIEPLLIYLLVNLDNISSAEGIKVAIDSIQSCLTFDIMPIDVSFILVVLFAYFGVAIAPGVLFAISLVVDSPVSSPHRDNGKSGIVRYPEIPLRGKLFLKLCHLLN
jgi:hypothetical protein